MTLLFIRSGEFIKNFPDKKRNFGNFGSKTRKRKGLFFIRSEKFIKDFVHKNSTPASLARAVLEFYPS